MTRKPEIATGLVDRDINWRILAQLFQITGNLTTRHRKKKFIEEVVGTKKNRGVDKVIIFHEGNIDDMIDRARELSEKYVVTARVIHKGKESQDENTVVGHMVPGICSFNDTFKNEKGWWYLYNNSAATASERKKKSNIQIDARQGWLFVRSPSKIVCLNGFQNLDKTKIIETRAGGGLRLQLNQIRIVEGKIYYSFEVSAVFGDGPVRRTAINPSTANGNELKKGEYPQLTLQIDLEFKNGKLVWPEEEGRNPEHTIANALKTHKAEHYTKAVIDKLLKQDGEALAFLFRTMLEVNPNPNSLSVELVFYNLNDLFVKVIDIDGVIPAKSTRGDKARFFTEYALRSIISAQHSVSNYDLKRWKRRSIRRPLLKNTIESARKDRKKLWRNYQRLVADERRKAYIDLYNDYDFKKLAKKGIKKVLKMHGMFDKQQLDKLTRIIQGSLKRHYSYSPQVNLFLLTQETTMPIYLGRLLKGAGINWKKIGKDIEVCSIDQRTSLLRINIAGVDFVYCIEGNTLAMPDFSVENKYDLNSYPNKLDIEFAALIFRKLTGHEPVSAQINAARHEGD